MSLTLEKLLLTGAGAMVASLAGDCCCLMCCWGNRLSLYTPVTALTPQMGLALGLR